MADDDGSRRPSQPSTPVNPAGVGAPPPTAGPPMAWCPPIPSEKSSTRETRVSSTMPLSIGTQLTSTVIWPPSEPHPPPMPPRPEWAVRPPTAPVQVPQSLRRPQGEWLPPVLVGEVIVEGPLRQDPPTVDAAPLRQEESPPLPREEVVHRPYPWEPVPREDDPDKVKKNPGDADVGVAVEEEEEDEDVRHVPTRRPPCRGLHRGGRRKAPLKRLSIKPICNDACACCSKTKNKLTQDGASPTSPRPTAS